MSSIFLDTGYIIALEASDDQHHQAAQRHWRAFLSSKPRLITTSYVFDEVVSFFTRRGRHAKAVEIGNRLRDSISVELIHVEEVLFEEGWRYFKRSADKAYSLTDCISFVLMERREISVALTFDHHFIQAGFVTLPDQGG
jgi:predicted nucleic acid-binding protein